MNWIEKYFGATGLKPDQIAGPIPATKDIIKRTLKIAWPSATEAVLISLIGAVDMMMVGQLGAGAIASVGITNQPKFILFSVIIALNIGLTVVVSRRKGQKDAASANQVVRNAIVITTLIAALFYSVGYIYAPQILKFSGATPDYIDTSIVYFRIVLIGLFFFSIGSTRFRQHQDFNENQYFCQCGQCHLQFFTDQRDLDFPALGRHGRCRSNGHGQCGRISDCDPLSLNQGRLYIPVI